MANMDQIRRDAEFQKALAEASEKYDGPQMETRPVPNDEQHRTFQLACRHGDLNDRYVKLLDEYEGALQGLRHVLDAKNHTDGAAGNPGPAMR